MNSNECITSLQILEAFDEAGVLENFQQLSAQKQKTMLGDINAYQSEDKKVEAIVKYIDRLNQ